MFGRVQNVETVTESKDMLFLVCSNLKQNNTSVFGDDVSIDGRDNLLMCLIVVEEGVHRHSMVRKDTVKEKVADS